MFEGTAMVFVWLATPAIVAIGSVGMGLAFYAISELWKAKSQAFWDSAALTAVSFVAYWSGDLVRNKAGAGWQAVFTARPVIFIFFGRRCP